MASTSNEEVKILEKPDTTTMVHEIKGNWYHLVERKEKTNVDHKASDNTPKITIFIHSRSITLKFGIEYRFFDVHETLTEGEDVADRLVKTGINFTTKMSQGQVEVFVKDWSNLWKPQTIVDFPNLDSTRPALHTLPFWLKISVDQINSLYFLFIT
jgi:hypothetical protein